MPKKCKIILAEILIEIKDFRNPNKIEYELVQILLVLIIGILVGLTHTLHIVIFAQCHEDWFKTNLKLNKIPSRQTLERVLAFVNFCDLESALILWLEELLKDKQARKRLAIDAKKTDKKSPNTTTFIRAFIGKLKLVVGSRRIPEYQNEITEIPKLLKKLFIRSYCMKNLCSISNRKNLQIYFRRRTKITEELKREDFINLMMLIGFVNDFPIGITYNHLDY